MKKHMTKRPRRLLLSGDQPQLKMLGVDGEGTGGFGGYGAVYGNIDRDEEILAQGVFAESLPDFLANGFIAEAHDWRCPVATVAAAREDDLGLYLEAEFHSDPASQAVRTRTAERLARGQSVGLSVGFRPEVWEYDEEKDLVTITKGELFEVSIVTVPANPLARVSAAKAAPWYDLPETEREFEDMLRGMGFTKQQAVTITSAGFKAAGFDRRDSGATDDEEVQALETEFLLAMAARNLRREGIPT